MMRIPTIVLLLLLASNAWGSAHPNLVAWYRAENNALDASGNGHHGVWGGTEAYDSSPFGAGFEFDGTAQVDVAHDPSLGFAGAITVAVWVNPSSISRFDCIVARASSAGVGWRLWTRSTSDFKFTWETRSGSHTSSVTSQAIGVWQHVACTHDGTTARIYINGVLDQSHETGSVEAEEETLIIGNMTEQTRFFTGGIDDVRIYNAALTPSDIRRVMQGKQPLHRY